MLGPQKILVALVTWGPKPFAREEVQRTVAEADAFYRKQSFGKASLVPTVTPWLTAYNGPPACVANSIREPGEAALRAAGYDPRAYDVVVYLHPDAGCPWSGATYAGVVFLNGAITKHLISHELGHAFGLPHANTTSCIRHSCVTLEYGDPYDTMGSGDGDFSAFAKARLGWITQVTRVKRAGTYTLDPLEQPASGSQAFVVTTAQDQYWIEDRTTAAGVLVHVSPSPDLRTPVAGNSFNALVTDPAGRGRAQLRAGDRFQDPGVFRVTVLRSATSARLRFTWLDGTPPSAPHITSSVVDGQVRVDVDPGRENGSGIARYRVTLDGGRSLSVEPDLTYEPIRVGRPLPGTHTVRVVAFDRAGNRSSAVVQTVHVR